MDLAEGLEQVQCEGAPAQADRARQLLVELRDGDPDAEAAALDLVRAFLHDPDLWR